MKVKLGKKAVIAIILIVLLTSLGGIGYYAYAQAQVLLAQTQDPVRWLRLARPVAGT